MLGILKRSVVSIPKRHWREPREAGLEVGEGLPAAERRGGRGLESRPQRGDLSAVPPVLGGAPGRSPGSVLGLCSFGIRR